MLQICISSFFCPVILPCKNVTGANQEMVGMLLNCQDRWGAKWIASICVPHCVCPNITVITAVSPNNKGHQRGLEFGASVQESTMQCFLGSLTIVCNNILWSNDAMFAMYRSSLISITSASPLWAFQPNPFWLITYDQYPDMFIIHSDKDTTPCIRRL